MKFVTLAVLAASSLIAAGAPAFAQPDWGRDRDRGHDESNRWDLGRRLEWLQRRIERGRNDGSLDRREAYRAQARLDDIRRDMRRWQRRGGLNGWQRQQLEERLDRLNGELRWLRSNDERRPW